MRRDFGGLRTEPSRAQGQIPGNNLSTGLASWRQRSFGPRSRQSNRRTRPSSMDGFLRECISADSRVLHRIEPRSAQMQNRGLAGRILPSPFHRLTQRSQQRHLLEFLIVLSAGRRPSRRSRQRERSFYSHLLSRPHGQHFADPAPCGASESKQPELRLKQRSDTSEARHSYKSELEEPPKRQDEPSKRIARLLGLGWIATTTALIEAVEMLETGLCTAFYLSGQRDRATPRTNRRQCSTSTRSNC